MRSEWMRDGGSGFVVSHPYARKKAQGWGTQRVSRDAFPGLKIETRGTQFFAETETWGIQICGEEGKAGR